MGIQKKDTNPICQVHNEFYKSANQRVRRFMEHALAIAGTHNTIKHLVHHIESRDISPIKAAQYLKAVQVDLENRFPQEAIVLWLG